jgi:hypothetical protein
MYRHGLSTYVEKSTYVENCSKNDLCRNDVLGTTFLARSCHKNMIDDHGNKLERTIAFSFEKRPSLSVSIKNNAIER